SIRSGTWALELTERLMFARSLRVRGKVYDLGACQHFLAALEDQQIGCLDGILKRHSVPERAGVDSYAVKSASAPDGLGAGQALPLGHRVHDASLLDVITSFSLVCPLLDLLVSDHEQFVQREWPHW